MARWSWAIGPWSSGEESELSAARARKLDFRLSGPATAAFDIDGTHPAAALIDELVTDLWVRRDGDLLYRGRVGPTQDAIDEAQHRTKVTTADYRAILSRRLWLSAAGVYTSTEQSDVAWAAIQETQGQTAGDLGITRGVGQVTGAVVDRTIEPGSYIGAELDRLARAGVADGAAPGFEWAISPDLEFDLYYPTRGDYRGSTVLERGGLLRKVDRKIDPKGFANAIRHNGPSGLSPQTAETADLATRPEGRWDKQFGDSTIATTAELSARAARELADAELIVPTWTAIFRDGGWNGPEHVWLGDTVRLVAKSGRVDFDGEVRVEMLSISLTDDDREEVSVQFGPTLEDTRDLLYEMRNNLVTLQRES